MRVLEAAVHGLVKEERLKFLSGSMERGESFVVLDVPLLFETDMESQVLLSFHCEDDEDYYRVYSSARRDIVYNKTRMTMPIMMATMKFSIVVLTTI